jgi:hypothetical protein
MCSPSIEQVTRAELEEIRVKLEAMPQHEMETFYKATHNACRYVMRLPPPCDVRHLWRDSAPGTFARQNGFAIN